MESPNKIYVLSNVKQLSALFKVYNRHNFKHHNKLRNTKNICIAFGVTILITSIPITCSLAIWPLLEFDHSTMLKIVSNSPTLFSMMYILIEFITLAVKNRTISETIVQLQIVVDQRKFFCLLEIWPICQPPPYILLSPSLLRKSLLVSLISKIEIISMKFPLKSLSFSASSRLQGLAAIVSALFRVREKTYIFPQLFQKRLFGNATNSSFNAGYVSHLARVFELSAESNFGVMGNASGNTVIFVL